MLLPVIVTYFESIFHLQKILFSYYFNRENNILSLIYDFDNKYKSAF